MPEQVRTFAPGRVNLIGEHTDYNQGLALPFAITKGITVVAHAADGDRITALASDLDATDEFELRSPHPTTGWRAFVRGVAAELQRAGIELRPGTLEIEGDLDRGAGLSSSAALEVAVAMALIALAGASSPGRLELAQLCSRVENEWVGAQTGLLDQLAVLFGERDRAVLIDFRSLEVSLTTLELGDFSLVTLDSGERHSHAASGYNERREECAAACRRLGLDSLRDASLAMADRLPPPLDGRVRHVVGENDRVRAAVEALGRHDMATLGQLLDRSHASLRDQFEISTPAVEDAVNHLHRVGAIGARLVGGGFGGTVLGLFGPDAKAPPEALEVRPGPGARVLESA